jgi:polysaccharide biosynthesis protein PslH
MRILIISPKIPYPPTDGGRRGIFGVIKYLKLRGHSIDVIAYRQNEKLSKSEGLKEFARLFVVDVETANNIYGMMKNIFSSVPYNLWKYQRTELIDALKDYFEKNKPDIIQVTNAHMGWVIGELRKNSSVPVILKEENLEMLIMQRFYQTQKNLFVKLYSFLQYKKFTKYEPALCAKFDLCVFVSREDAKQISKMNDNIKTTAIPAGVEGELLGVDSKAKEPYSLLHMGSLNWFPNYDGIRWFLNEVFPFVLKKTPSTKLYLYGGGIPKNFTMSNDIKSSVVIMGFVDNIWQSISDKLLSIVPLRIGGGIRVKILELLASGQNIISTTLGAEGIPVEDGKDIIIADSPEQFAERIHQFFLGKYNAEAMRCVGRELIRKNYTWEIIAEMYEHQYNILIGKN